MKLIAFSRSSDYPSVPEDIDIQDNDLDSFILRCSRKGTFSLSSEKSHEELEKLSKKAGFIACGEKGKKIDLRRAFKFDEKRDRSKPKTLIFKTNSIGAFKRAFNAFYLKHYSSEDPACIIYVPDEIHSTMLTDFSKLQQHNEIHDLNDLNDPILKLIRIPGSDPKIKRLEDVYVGNSLKTKHTRALIYRASMTDSPVLILGETGTGKDVIASLIFELSTSYKRDFFRINCSSLQESLLEGELFGYKKGIFTGAATDKEGLFSLAENGTIFLDEIGDLSLANQVKILHAVEKKGIRQIGGARTKPVNVRIIAATNRNLDAMMMQGTFREDLYYRISTFRITSPPLREHPEDIPLLAESYWKRKKRKGRLSKRFLDFLKEYSWPGNVRELNSMLNSLIDYFGDISPTPEHVQAIRRSRQESLAHHINNPADDPDQLLKIKSQNILINVQNILRALKIEIQPVIEQYPNGKTGKPETRKIRDYLTRQMKTLNELCLEPAYFKDWKIFEATSLYRQLLENALEKQSDLDNILKEVWDSELKLLDEKINHRIMEMIWGKIDL